MKSAFIIAKKDINEIIHTRYFYLYIVLCILLTIPYFSGIKSIVGGLAPEELRSSSRSLLSGVFSVLPLTLMVILSSVFSAYAIVMEKAKRSLESLLATPLSLKQIWLGKSLAIALPGIVIGLVISLLALLAINWLIIVPKISGFIMPNVSSLIASLVIMPIMAFLLVLIVSFLQLIMANPRIANFAFIAIFLGLYITTVNGSISGSWNFLFIYLIAVAALAALSFCLSRLLAKERVVLSSKG
jgi:ABC-2 type transport system permease protein